jgi:hypothetical protein
VALLLVDQAVAFELMPGEYLGYVVFFTPAIILLYGAPKQGWDVVGLAGERIGLTALPAVMAVALTAVALRTASLEPPPAAPPAARNSPPYGHFGSHSKWHRGLAATPLVILETGEYLRSAAA